MKSELPPIPPNCDLFKETTTGTYFNMPGEIQWMDRPVEGRRRTIIAAVARCAWEDQKRIYEKYQNPNDRHSEYLKWVECHNNAESWGIWGDQK